MNIREAAFWVMIIFILGLGIYVIKFIHSESYQCMNNPYTYSIGLLEKANNANVSCVCTAFKPNGAASVLLDRKGFSELDNLFKGNATFDVLNISEFSKASN